MNHGAQDHMPAHDFQEQLLRCQYLYFCTSKSSKLSGKLSEYLEALLAVLDAGGLLRGLVSSMEVQLKHRGYLEALLAVLDAGGLLACGSIEVQLEVQR